MANGHVQQECASVPLPREWREASPEARALWVKQYEEACARDGGAERRAWWWSVSGLAALGALGLSLLLNLFQAQRATVMPLVQLVQVGAGGDLVQLGEPLEVLRYAPAEGLWFDLLAQWVRAVRWRGIDPVLAQTQWQWVGYHTCGPAVQQLRAYEAQATPLVVSKKTVSVALKSVTKTPAPASYQVLWSETSIEGAQPPVTKQYTGTFTTGRIALTTQEAILQNRLGLCVKAFDISVQP